MKNKLAIIIPAYKACFFREVLDSIVRQSNRDFTVYIGDDASPDDLESIVSDYKDKLDIFYFRFEQNWGGRDLVAHWERCIELSDEPLVWLFSDDDLMPPDAVERVIKGWKKSGECGLPRRRQPAGRGCSPGPSRARLPQAQRPLISFLSLLCYIARIPIPYQHRRRWALAGAGRKAP